MVWPGLRASRGLLLKLLKAGTLLEAGATNCGGRDKLGALVLALVVGFVAAFLLPAAELPAVGNSGVTVTWPPLVFMPGLVFGLVFELMLGICANAGIAEMEANAPSMSPSAIASCGAFLGLKRVGAVKHGKVIQYRNR